MTRNSFPLDGITVVSIEQAVAAPFASRQLADLGARVIKVERPEGDFARQYDTSVHGDSSYFVWLNRSKESISLNLKNEDDLALLHRMIGQADVFIQNLGPGVAEKLGVSYPVLKQLNPTLIYAAVTGYGELGPYEKKKAYDLLVAAESGLLSITGTEEEMARVGVSIVDIAAGMYAFSGILAAVIHRMKSGDGAELQISLLDAIGEWVMQPHLYAHYGATNVPRLGLKHPTIAPYGPIRTANGAVLLSIQNEREWHRFCATVLATPELATKKEFSTNQDRVQHRELLDSAIEAILEGVSTTELSQRLDDAEIANSIVRGIGELRYHPQLQARDRWQDVQTPGGSAQVLRFPVETNSFNYKIGRVPGLGENSQSIRDEFGGT